jgi:DNA processing protein
MRHVSESERLALAALTRVAEPGEVAMVALVDQLGAEEVVRAIRAGTLPSDKLPAYAARLRAAHPEVDLVHVARRAGRLVCPGDLEWPTQLDDLGAQRPLALWVRGAVDLRQGAVRSVSMVGSRAATGYGEHVAGEMAAVIAERGWTVVSGAAYGIDSAAHRGALAVEGVTVAVLACGVDVAYPRSNAALLERIAAEGAIVSELAPGCSVTRPRFLARNRVIAALTRGTVVVEAAVRSGARTTAKHAVDLGRHLMVVPGPVTSAASAGCHVMLREYAGAAQLVTDGAEVLDLVGSVGDDLALPRRGPETVDDGLDADTRQVKEALPKRRAAPVDRIALKAGLHVPRVLASLAALETAGLAERVGDYWRLARPIDEVSDAARTP